MNRRSFVATTFAAGASCAFADNAAGRTFQAVECEGVYPNHLQGFCTNERDAIFWCFTTVLVKTDINGRSVRKVPVANHHGDLCYRDGRLYVAVNLGRFNEQPGNADSWVCVYDAETLAEVARHPVPELVHGAGGIAFHNGGFLVVGGLPPGAEANPVYEYDKSFTCRKRHILAGGYTLMGIQTVTHADGAWWFGCYGKPEVLLRTDETFRLTGKWEFSAAVGILPLAPGRFLIARNSVAKEADGKSRGNQARLVIARPDAKAGMIVEP